MIDAVLSYHTDPAGCGVAKFNLALAKRLGVPMLRLDRHPHVTPLISIKTAEITFQSDCAEDACWYRVFDLFFHDSPDSAWSAAIMQARRVYVAANTIGARPDQIVGFCPSTIDGNPRRGAYRVLTFGMIHKQLASHFTQLKHRLDTEHPDYTVELSAAQHEGKTKTVDCGAAALRDIFGDKLRVLGNLSDDALAKEIQDVDAVALYYSPAFRANNTTGWAALAAGKTLYTNTDEHSPELDPAKYSWDRLLELIRA